MTNISTDILIKFKNIGKDNKIMLTGFQKNLVKWCSTPTRITVECAFKIGEYTHKHSEECAQIATEIGVSDNEDDVLIHEVRRNDQMMRKILISRREFVWIRRTGDAHHMRGARAAHGALGRLMRH
jgi:hypothetical protein